MSGIGPPIEIPFAKGSAALSKAAKAAAAKVADVLVAYPLYGALLTSGAARGERSPKRLADRRAAAVTGLLLGPGRVPPDRIWVAVKRSRRREVSALVVEAPLPGL